MMDQRVLDWVVAHRTPWLTDGFMFVTNVGGVVGMTLVASLLTLALLVRNHRLDALLVGGSMLSGWLVMNLVKLLIGRDRPPFPQRLVEEASSAMPSGHAMLSAVLVCVVGAVIFRLRPPRNPVPMYILLGAITTLDGVSRVYLGAHWLTDVLVGWALGVAWAMAWIRGLR
ncbi:phosphatase PAP2 family protein [Antrihabitans cavernicola]|uniref:Phosphatase PAP2 family protein n=1 Tax=Antrihabitans cavernicola TaxID=2495913 RepID=A0A5A7S7P5_9NOCA|nr:phosphatase PAP2 family protein [Spelaeibacter cavernicola]KAA0021219.1 phosphatase PAP2 family protein [Spelaeibacter cavernicola]